MQRVGLGKISVIYSEVLCCCAEVRGDWEETIPERVAGSLLSTLEGEIEYLQKGKFYFVLFALLGRGG